MVDNDNSRWFDKSLVEVLQETSPKTRVVKAFNTIAMEVLDTSTESLSKAGAQHFIAGNDDDARAVVADLSAGLGLGSVDLGPGKVAMRAAEALGDVIRYFILSRQLGGRANLGFRMLPDPDLNLVGSRTASQYK